MGNTRSSAAGRSMGESPAKPAVRDLIVQLQAELRQIANRELHGERMGHTLQPTALVNEAFLRLGAQRNLDDASHGSFLAAAAKTMRRILIDHARARQADKRGDPNKRVTLTGLEITEDDSEVEILALHDALKRLAKESARMASVVELRYFAGLTVDETAKTLGVSARTVAGDWVFARAWLKRAMGK